MTGTHDILALWERVANRLVFLEKHYVYRRGRLALHPSELHMLLAIRDEPKANATKLAGRLGITKGAVSQVLKRLEAKKVISKRSDSAQKNEVTASFTALGKSALAAFLAERAQTGERFHGYVASLSRGEQAIVLGFLKQMEAVLPGKT
jgi:DNA-binding MarR family transcriptional regulator